jgi:hypothetical protein
VRTFLQELFDHGRVSVPLPGRPFEPLGEGTEVLGAFARSARQELPAGLPEVDFGVAAWAAERLAEICRLTIARAAGPDEFAPAFSVPCPVGESPATHFSADLFLRHLPLLSSFTERLAPDDPLLAEIAHFAAAWPLSSVGMKLPGPPEPGRIATLAASPALLRVYADRIVAAADVSRLAVPQVSRAVREALGAHPELSPAIARALEAGVPFSTPS